MTTRKATNIVFTLRHYDCCILFYETRTHEEMGLLNSVAKFYYYEIEKKIVSTCVRESVQIVH